MGGEGVHVGPLDTPDSDRLSSDCDPLYVDCIVERCFLKDEEHLSREDVVGLRNEEHLNFDVHSRLQKMKPSQLLPEYFYSYLRYLDDRCSDFCPFHGRSR